MITAIKNTNSDLYKDLFAKASEVLSGYERTQTFDENKTYFYKDSKTNAFTELVFESDDKEGKIYEFANALIEHGHLYVSNGKNPADYNFAPELGITTLEEYYNWLPQIKADEEGKPTVFTKLPLDEAHFEINPNTRAITIPTEFKKNGIAVQGDDLAEVVYFMIDRFFDAMDLNNTEIYIEWETPKSKTGVATKSVSETYLKIIDDENYPGKLIFGWAISDAITKDSGTLKFAVRFVQWNEEGKLVYSFNTLTAQATVHPNLGLDLENDTYKIDNCNDRLLSRIQESEVVGGIQAATPYFLQDLVVIADGYDIVPNHREGTYDLTVIATADDTGAVSYVWKRSEIGADAWVEIPGSTAVSFVELTVAEYEKFGWKLPENHTYYIDRQDGTADLLPKGYYDLTDAATKNWFKTTLGVDIDAGEVPHLSEKRSVLTVDKYGQYKAEARNRIFNSLTKANSKIVTFKTPDPVVMDNSKQTVDKHIVNETSATLMPEIVPAVGDLSYQWFKAEETSLLSEKFNFLHLPEGGKVSYSSTFARILCPTNPDVYYEQSSGIGGNKDRFYITMRHYAPAGAVSFRMVEANSLTANPVVDDSVELDILKNMNGYGKEGDREYFDRWIHIAGRTNGVWKSWPTGKGEGEYIGYSYNLVWYDVNGTAIENSAIKVQLANETNFNANENFQEISGATSDFIVASEPGIYKMEVTRVRNRAETKGESIEYRVTEAPAVPTYTEGVYDEFKKISIDSLINNEQDLMIAWNNDIQSDEFYITWFLDRSEKNLADLEVVTYKVTNEFESHFDPTDYKAVLDAAKEDVEGWYYGLVKNKLNGVISDYSVKPDSKKMFNVTGS